MSNLSIEELEEMRAYAYSRYLERFVRLIDETIAIRELKGDQVPVAWTSQRSLETKNKIVAFTDDMSALDYCIANGWTDIVELFTASQKPVVLPKFGPNDDPHNLGRNIGIKECKAAIEAAGGIVKDGE